MSARPQIELHCGNAVKLLKQIEAESIDSAVFDPPYPTISGGSNQDKSGKHQRPSGILSKNDGKIFEHNDIKPSVYLPEVYRVLKPQAHVYLMTNVYNLVNKDIMGDIRRAGFGIHNLLFWRKNNATPNRWYMKDTELTIFARKGKAFPINNPGSRSTMSVDPHPKDRPGMWLDDESLGYAFCDMEDFFDYPLDHDNVPSPKAHPTEKPVNLMKTYIENSTQPGDLVLDPFAGVGSTGVAAQEAGRAFVGMELAEEFCATASNRLHTAVIDYHPARSVSIEDLLGDPDPEIEDLLA